MSTVFQQVMTPNLPCGPPALTLAPSRYGLLGAGCIHFQTSAWKGVGGHNRHLQSSSPSRNHWPSELELAREILESLGPSAIVGYCWYMLVLSGPGPAFKKRKNCPIFHPESFWKTRFCGYLVPRKNSSGGSSNISSTALRSPKKLWLPKEMLKRW